MSPIRSIRRRWIRRRRWPGPVVRGKELSDAAPQDAAQELAARFALPRYLCIHERMTSQRADAVCIEVPTGRNFAIERGATWGRVYVPTHRPLSRSTARATTLAERWLTVLLAGD